MAERFEGGTEYGLRSRGGYDVEIRLEGDWVKFSRLINSTNLVLAAAARQGQKGFAEDYCKAVKQNIRTGGKRFGYPQNEGEYLRRKQLHGYGSVALKVSGTMMSSVRVMINSTKTIYSVGIPTGISRPTYWPSDSNNLEVHEYANIVEHGFETNKTIVPARPVFSDTFRITMGGKEGIRKYIERSIAVGFGAMGVIVKKRR
jgi:hypothetical protein